MPESKRRYIALAKRKDKVIQSAVDAFVGDLRGHLKAVDSRMGQLVRSLETKSGAFVTTRFNLTRALNVRNQISEELVKRGLEDDVMKLMSSYDDAAVLALEGLTITGRAAAFAEADIDALAALKELDFRHWAGFGRDLADDVTQKVVGAVVSGGKVEELARSLEDTLRGMDDEDPRIVAKAETLANTYMHAFDRTVSARSAKIADIDTFIYVGPDDDVTRPFCDAVLHGEGGGEFGIPKAEIDGEELYYTSEDIGGMDNGQGLPVQQFGGGYNCRHGWYAYVPVEEEAEVAA